MSLTAPSYNTQLVIPQLPYLAPTHPAYTDVLALYAGLTALAQQIDTVLTLSEDIRINSATRGLILKDSQATPHYWRVTVSTVGVLVVTDIGTSLP